MNKQTAIAKTLVAAIAAGMLTACSQGASGTADAPSAKPQKEAPAEPVTLTIAAGWKITDEDFNQIFVKPVQAKYPHISLNLTVLPANKLPDMIASGDYPDLLISGNASMQTLLDLNLALDLNEQIRQQGFDMSRIEPNIEKSIKSYGKKGEIFALPYGMNYNALYYNKALFDRFGVAYPKDGMTWDDVIELAKKVTHTDGGIQYRGLETSNVVRIASPLSLNLFDPATGKANINTEDWRKAYRIFQSILSIPGNVPQKKGRDEIDAFLYDKTVSMLPTLGLFHRMPEAAKGGLDWDLVTYPQYPEKPGVYGEVDGYFLFITPKSKHQKEAFQVIAAALADDAQLASSRLGKVVTPLRSKEVREKFGTESDSLKGKNVQAIFKHQPASVHTNLTKYDSLAESQLFTNSLDLYKEKDINTIIRETEEAINQKVASMQGK